MAQAPQPEVNCAICNKPVNLRTTKTDERGKAVHERCSARKQALIRAALAINQRPVTLGFTALGDSSTAPFVN